MIQRLSKRSQFLFVRAGFRASRGAVLVEARRREADGAIGVGLRLRRRSAGRLSVTGRNVGYARRLVAFCQNMGLPVSITSWWRGNRPHLPLGLLCLTMLETH
jgi:hypothetical protein